MCQWGTKWYNRRITAVVCTFCMTSGHDVITGLEHSEHFSRSENDDAIYQNDAKGRLSLLIPFKSLQGSYLLIKSS